MFLIIIGALIIIAGICFLGGASAIDFWEGVLITLGVIAFFALIVGGIVLIFAGIGIL